MECNNCTALVIAFLMLLFFNSLPAVTRATPCFVVTRSPHMDLSLSTRFSRMVPIKVMQVGAKELGYSSGRLRRCWSSAGR